MAALAPGCGGDDQTDSGFDKDAAEVEENLDIGINDPGLTDTVTDVPKDTDADLKEEIPGDPGQTAEDVDEGLKDLLDDPGGQDDGGSQPQGPHPLFEFTGKVEMAETTNPEGGAHHSGAGVIFWDAAPGTSHTLVNEMGGCQYWLVIFPGTCEPACNPDQYCGTDSECHPYRNRTGAGTVTITGTTTEVQAVPDESDWYVVQGETPDDLFGPGDEITVQASGGDIPAFTRTLTGVGDMLAPWASVLTMLDGSDLYLPWTVQGDGATVELALQIGWHGAPPVAIIWCTAPDDAGAITVPQMFVEAFPPAGGIGLFQHISWVERVSREVVDGPYGPIEIKVAARRNFSLIHNAW